MAIQTGYLRPIAHNKEKDMEQALKELLDLRESALRGFGFCHKGVLHIGNSAFRLIQSGHPEIWATIENDIEVNGTVRHVSGDEKIYVAVKYVLKLKEAMNVLLEFNQRTYNDLCKQLSVSHVVELPLDFSEDIADFDGLSSFTEHIWEVYEDTLRNAAPLIKSNMKDEEMARMVQERFSDTCRALYCL